MSFAPDIHCPVYISYGLCDLTGVTTSIYAMINQMPSKQKFVKGHPNGIHSTSSAFPEADAALKALAGK